MTETSAITSADVIVVGSGPSAVHATCAALESGASVIMLDVGYRDDTYERLVPALPFSQIRKTDKEQHRYFLGDRFEGIRVSKMGAGPQVTPARRYALEDPQRLLPIASKSFEALQSLALGGLGCLWGAVALPFLDGELTRAGMVPQEMREHYCAVLKRIGVNGDRDDIEQFRGPTEPLLPPLDLDHNADAILGRYSKKKRSLNQRGVYVGRAETAVLTKDWGERHANPLCDMDFWTNPGQSIYRPDITVGGLQCHPNFSYRAPFLVQTFGDRTDGVSVEARDLNHDRTEIFKARKLILAAGALGTGRIVLRSLKQYGVAVPITCNMHLYIPCLNYRTLGHPHKDRCHSLAQLTMIYDPKGDREHLAQAQIYSYRSLLLFRLLHEMPLPYREALGILRAISSSLIVTVVQFEDEMAAGNQCVLRRDSTEESDTLEIEYAPTPELTAHANESVRAFKRSLRKLGCIPLRVAEPGHGASVHYASLLPFSDTEKPLTTHPSGRLHGTENVYIADGASFKYLPAKGLTLTLMANANRVGRNAVRDITFSFAGESVQRR